MRSLSCAGLTREDSLRYLTAALSTLLLVAAAAATPTAGARPCGNVSFRYHSSVGAFDIVAVRVTCLTARRVASASRPASLGPGFGPTRSYRKSGFTCVGTDNAYPGPLTGMEWVTYRCGRARGHIRFTRAG